MLSLAAAAIIDICVKKKQRKESYGNINEFFSGAGDALKGPISIVICGTVFSAAISALGGFSIVMNFIVDHAGLSFIALLYIIIILSYVINFLTGNVTVPMLLFSPILVESATIAGRTDLLPLATLLLCMAGMGMAFSPTRTNLLMINGQFGIDLTKMIKRIAPVYTLAFILSLIISYFVFVI